MKKITRFFAVLLITILSVTSTVFADTTVTQDEIINNIEIMIFDSFAAYDEEFIDFSIENNIGFVKEAYKNYLQLIEGGKLGSFIKFENSRLETTKTGYDFFSDMLYEKGQLEVCVTYTVFSQSNATIVSIEFKTVDTENKSMLDKMGNAAINTLIGMTTVVVVLILISWLISLFKFIPVLQEKFANRGNKVSATDKAVDNAIAQITEKEELADDMELIAVITAAICASTGASSDSFVVRSIKKARRNR